MKMVKLGDLLCESKIESTNPDPNRRITVRLFMKGVEKRPFEAGVEGGTKYYTRRAGQFIYGKQNLFKGAYGIIPEELDGYDSSSDIPAFDVREDCLPEWIYYWFKQGNYYQKLEAIATGTGSRRIQPSRLLEIKIPLPDIDEQRAMLRKVTEAEVKFQTLNMELERQSALLGKLKQSILQDSVQGKLVKQDPNEEPAQVLLEKIKKEKQKLIVEGKQKKEKELPPINTEDIPFELPEGWLWCRLADIATIKSRLVDPSLYSEYFQVGPDSIEKGTGKLISERNVLEAGVTSWNHLFYSNHIIYSKIRPNLSKAWIATKEGLCSADMYPIQSHIDINYLHSYILSEPFLLQVVKTDNRVKMPKINQDELNKVMVPVPPLREQKRISQKLIELRDATDTIEFEIYNAKKKVDQLTQSILREAFKQKDMATPIRRSAPLQKTDKEENHFVKRKVLATYIINHSLTDNQFGDVKFEKLLHLADYFAIKRNLGQAYYQQAAGPYDNAFTLAYFQQIENAKWFKRTRVGSQYTFYPGEKHEKSQNTYGYFSEAELRKVDEIIDYFKKSDYEQPEIISTLYAVWNNRLIRNAAVNDDLLIEDFYDWDKQKAKYERPRLVKALKWMRDKQFVPDGWGKLIERAKSKTKSKARAITS